jgi:hypothetical protein
VGLESSNPFLDDVFVEVRVSPDTGKPDSEVINVDVPVDNTGIVRSEMVNDGAI